MSGLLGQWREIDHENYWHLSNVIAEEERDSGLSKQEAIARAESRLREEIEGLHAYVDSLFPDTDRKALGETNETRLPREEEPLAVFMEKLVGDINELALVVNNVHSSLIRAIVVRDVEDQVAQVPDPSVPFE